MEALTVGSVTLAKKLLYIKTVSVSTAVPSDPFFLLFVLLVMKDGVIAYNKLEKQLLHVAKKMLAF